MKRLVLILFLLFAAILVQVPVHAQTSPSLAWDQSAPGSIATQVQGWSWELWVNGTGQLPLLTAVCTGTGPFTCSIPYSSLPAAARSEGLKSLELVAVPPTGVKSARSSTFQVTVAASPTNLRLLP